MRILILFALFTFSQVQAMAQSQIWQTFMDTVPSFSSPRAVDLTGDGVLDIVLGGGIDGIPHANGIMAFNGVDGTLLWKRATHNEIFISANFQDINNDGTPDVFIGGRDAQFYSISGVDGALIWDFYPHPFAVNPGSIGLWNFYSPQFIPDMNNDGLQEILVANGGDHSLPLWETNRPPGHLMILNAANGSILAKAVVPDSAETYCSPLVIDLKNDGNLWVLYGTGGESLGGKFYAALLTDLINQNLSNSVVLASHPTRGFIAPASVHKSLMHSGYDIVVQGFGGQIYKFSGQNFEQIWMAHVPGTESSAQPVLGNFTGGDHTPDVFAVLYKGNMTSYTDYYQVMINGETGQILFKDSIGTLHFPSANAVDLNNDGRDEAIGSITYHQNGYFHHKLLSFDFQNNTIQQLHQNVAGVNLGCTPLIRDLDNDGLLDVVYVVRADSLNPVGMKGIKVIRYALASEVPNAGIAWGSYIGTDYDGIYHYAPTDCGPGSVVATAQVNSPTCNGLSNGSINLVLSNPAEHHTYLWSDGSVGPTLTGIGAGTYKVRITNTSGCYEDLTLACQNPYVITVGGIVAPTCPGGNNGMATFNSSGCPCMFNTCVFTWSDGTIGSHNAQLTSGWHGITIAHPNGCVVQDSVFIPESPSAVISQTVQHLTCYGSNNGAIQLTGNPNFNVQYAWNTGQQTSTLSGLSAGNYQVTVTDNRPCNQVLVFSIQSPDSLSIEPNINHLTCNSSYDGSVEVTALGGTPSYTYHLNATTYTNPIITNLFAGNYQLYVSDANNCVSSTMNFELLEPELITAEFDVTNSSGGGMADGSINTSVSGGTPPYTMDWLGLNPANLYGGNYQVVITDANGCSASYMITVHTLNTDVWNLDNFSMYPNPASTHVHIVTDAFDFAEIFTLDGKLMHQGTSSIVQLTDFSAGLYLVRIYHQGSSTEVKLAVVR